MSLIPRRKPTVRFCTPNTIELRELTIAHTGVSLNPVRIAYAWFQFHIKASQFGAVMGRGGSRLSQIRRLTGCRIRIHDENQRGMHLVMVRHKESQSQVHTANLLIAIAISVFSRPNTGHLSLLEAIDIIDS